MPGTRKKWPHPPLDASTAFAQWSYRFRDLVNRGLGEAGMALIAYVDKGGDDGSAVIGSLVNTFLTIQAAIDALVAAGVGEKTVVIGPGGYAETIIWPNTDNLSLVGSGPGTTIIQGAGVTHSVVISAPALANALHNGAIRNLSISNDVNNLNVFALLVDGTLAADVFDEGGFTLDNCRVYKEAVADNAALFFRLNFLRITDCQFGPRIGGHDVDIQQCAAAWIDGVFGKNLTVVYDSTLAVPAQPRNWIAMSNAIWSGALTGTTIPLVACGADVQVGSITFNSTDVSDGGAGEWHGRLDFHGRVVGNAALAAIWSVDVGRNNDPAFRFKDAIVGGWLSLQVDETAAGCSTLAGGFYDCLVYEAVVLTSYLTAASATVAEFLHCAFKSTFTLTDDGADAFGGGVLAKQSVFTPGNAISCLETLAGGADPFIDLRSAFFDESDLVVSNSGGIDRSMIHGQVIAGAGPQTPTFVSLPTGTTDYGVSLDFANIGAAPASITTKLADRFTITRTGALGTIDWVLLRPAP